MKMDVPNNSISSVSLSKEEEIMERRD